MLYKMDQKVEIKQEQVWSEETASTSIPFADFKHEMTMEEHTVGQLVPCFKEENNVENIALFERGPVDSCDSCCKVSNSRNELTTETEEKLHCCNVCTEELLSDSGEGSINAKEFNTILTQRSEGDGHAISASGKSKHKEHMSVNDSNLLYVCNECGKIVSTKSNLRQHISSHTGERRHCCEECGKLFTRNSNLKQHMFTHSRERPHLCSECGKTFSLKSHLITHSVIHTGERRHCCFKCGILFSRTSILKSHLLTHSREKPHVCSLCDKRFSGKSTLKRHILSHSGQRLHICDDCGMSFTRRSTLKGHMVIHCKV